MVSTENLLQLPHRKLHSVRTGHSRQRIPIHVSSDVVCHLVAYAALVVRVYLQKYLATLIQRKDKFKLGRSW